MKARLKQVLICLVILGTFVTVDSSAVAAVTLHPGDILIADLNALGGGGAIIRVDPASGAQTIVSSGGSFIGPAGIAIAANGDLLIANAGGQIGAPGSIIRVNPTTGGQTKTRLVAVAVSFASIQLPVLRLLLPPAGSSSIRSASPSYQRRAGRWRHERPLPSGSG